MNQFDYIASIYDKWKYRGPFYMDYEKPYVLKEIDAFFSNFKGTSYSFLDIGTGTGIWAEEIEQYAEKKYGTTRSFAVGIDNSPNMLSVAVSKKIPNMIFLNKDLSVNDKNIIEGEKFDLITGGLCMDYIGVRPTFNIIKDNLKEGGTAIIWFFNPDRYEGSTNLVKKKWTVFGEEIEIQSNRIDIPEIFLLSNELNLQTNIKTIDLPVFNGVSRGLKIQVTTHNNG